MLAVHKIAVFCALLQSSIGLFGPHFSRRLIYKKAIKIDHPRPSINPLSYANPGSDALGFAGGIVNEGFTLSTQVIFGSNAIEHGINLIEEKTNNILIVSGWNTARLDPIFWEIEPRGFQFQVVGVPDEPTSDDVSRIARAALATKCEAILAVGCGSTIDATKMACALLNSGVRAGEALPTLSPEAVQAELLKEEHSALKKPQQIGHGVSTGAVPSDKRVMLITAPALPSMGAEFSSLASLHLIPSSEEDEDSPTYGIDDSAICKRYIRVSAPSLCLIQPGLTYRAPMELLHDRILTLMATAVDIVLSDAGFLPEMLAWDALRMLVPLLDKAVECSKERFIQKALSPEDFEELTVHDDESDHRSQVVRRFGHGFEASEVEDITRIGAMLASARAGSRSSVSALQYLTDSLGALSGQSKGFSCRMAKLFPVYLTVIDKWSNEEDDAMARPLLGSTSGSGVHVTDERAYRAFIRTKLERISAILSGSKILSYDTGSESANSGEKTSESKAIRVNRDIRYSDLGMAVPADKGQDDVKIAAAMITVTATARENEKNRIASQMRSLMHHMRLLAGPMETNAGELEEEVISCLTDMAAGDVSGAASVGGNASGSSSGDALSLLQADLQRRLAEGDPTLLAMKKEKAPMLYDIEDSPATISSYIVDHEGDSDDAGVREKFAHHRDLPRLQYATSSTRGASPTIDPMQNRADDATDTDAVEAYRIKTRVITDLDLFGIRMGLKEACGEVPAAFLSASGLLEILSAGGREDIVSNANTAATRAAMAEIAALLASGSGVNARDSRDTASASGPPDHSGSGAVSRDVSVGPPSTSRSNINQAVHSKIALVPEPTQVETTSQLIEKVDTNSASTFSNEQTIGGSSKSQSGHNEEEDAAAVQRRRMRERLAQLTSASTMSEAEAFAANDIDVDVDIDVDIDAGDSLQDDERGAGKGEDIAERVDEINSSVIKRNAVAELESSAQESTIETRDLDAREAEELMSYGQSTDYASLVASSVEAIGEEMDIHELELADDASFDEKVGYLARLLEARAYARWRSGSGSAAGLDMEGLDRPLNPEADGYVSVPVDTFIEPNECDSQ